MTGSIALDTNAVIAYRADVPDVVRTVETADRVFLPLVVLGELLYGAEISGRPVANRQAVLDLAAGCVLLEPDRQTAEIYASIRGALKRAGTPLPENDVWVASICLQWNLPLLTRDAHSQKVLGLNVAPFSLT